jgi:hypothetical protein
MRRGFGSCGPPSFPNSQKLGCQKLNSTDVSPQACRTYYLKKISGTKKKQDFLYKCFIKTINQVKWLTSNEVNPG